MARRCGILSSPPAPLAVLALLLVLGFSHCAAAARLLPATSTAPPHQDIGVVNVKAADAASVDRLAVVRTEGGMAGNGEEAVSSEVTTAAEEVEEEEACGEGNDDGEEECMQRRLLHDAHLDYIYTQHKGRP